LRYCQSNFSERREIDPVTAGGVATIANPKPFPSGMNYALVNAKMLPGIGENEIDQERKDKCLKFLLTK